MLMLFHHSFFVLYVWHLPYCRPIFSPNVSVSSYCLHSFHFPRCHIGPNPLVSFRCTLFSLIIFFLDCWDKYRCCSSINEIHLRRTWLTQCLTWVIMNGQLYPSCVLCTQTRINKCFTLMNSFVFLTKHEWF